MAPHPDEAQLLRSIRRSPADPRTWIVRCHLRWCKSCRIRVETADAELVRLFHAHVPSFGGLDSGFEQSRGRLMAGMRALDAERETTKHQRVRRRRIAVLGGAGVLTAGLAVGLLVSLRKQETGVNAAAVLADAARQENPEFEAQPGVVFQRLQVRDGNQQAEWLVYRDRQGKREARFRPVSDRESRLRQRLTAAGITREDPLSVSSFQKWRNRLTSCRDNVVLSPSGLITVNTSAAADPGTPVLEETLLLRRSDYHAISRSVIFRDSEKVEIAELDYRVLDWAQVQKDWFFEAEAAAIPAPRLPARVVPMVKAVRLDAAALDLAELKTRLILSTHNADTGEQIELVRGDDGIRVDGLASSPDRKRELEGALESVPHVTAKLLTPEEREAGEPNPIAPSRIKVIESASQPSPLLVFLKGKPGQIDAYRPFSAKIMDSSLRISQQSHAVAELESEFAPRMPLDQEARQVYESVFKDHIAKLKSALADQAEILKSLSGERPASSASETGATGFSDLAVHAARSLALSRELVSGQSANQRDALLILDDLAIENSSLFDKLDSVLRSRTQP